MPGTMRKRGKDSYYLEVTIGTDFRGKPNRYSKTVHGTKKQAEKELAKFYTDCENGKITKASTMTISQLCDLYRTEYAERHLKVSAQQSAVSGISVRNYYSTLRSIIDFALDMDIIADTPCKNIKLPKKEHVEANYYNMEEVDALLGALNSLSGEELKFKAAIYIGLFGGLRKGEILGLNWEDINFFTGETKISRTRMIQRRKGTYEDTPKPEKSRRTIALPTEVISMLRSLQLQQKQLKLLLSNKYEDSPFYYFKYLHPSI